MRRMKSSPICILICCRDRLILPVVAIWVGMSLHVSTVEAMSSSNRDVCGSIKRLDIISLLPCRTDCTGGATSVYHAPTHFDTLRQCMGYR